VRHGIERGFLRQRSIVGIRVDELDVLAHRFRIVAKLGCGVDHPAAKFGDALNLCGGIECGGFDGVELSAIEGLEPLSVAGLAKIDGHRVGKAGVQRIL
jgi:hypothetical protein